MTQKRPAATTDDNEPTRRQTLAAGGTFATLSILPNWVRFWDDDEETTDDRLETLENEVLRHGPLEDRPDAEDTPDGRKWLDDGGIITTVADDEWIVDRLIDEPESALGGMLFIDNSTTTTITTENEWVQIEGDSQPAILREFSHSESENFVRYDGDYDTIKRVAVTISYVANVNNAEFEFALFANGEVPDTRLPINANTAEEVYNDSISNLIALSPGDEFLPQIRCTAGTDDVTVTNLSITLN